MFSLFTVGDFAIDYLLLVISSALNHLWTESANYYVFSGYLFILRAVVVLCCTLRVRY